MKRPVLITIFCLLILGSVAVCVYAFIPKHVTNIKVDNVALIELVTSKGDSYKTINGNAIYEIMGNLNKSKISTKEIDSIFTVGEEMTVSIYKNDGSLYKKLSFGGSMVKRFNGKYYITYDPAVDIELIRSYARPPKPAQQS